ncbi:MAG: lipid-A-disaccharide synthase [Oligoflexales bacterium]|nr:lipid-A-disaccharide synthase [Oligoflexales bacterium]
MSIANDTPRHDLSRHVFISAGEYSGELIAEALVKQLHTLCPEIRFSGIGSTLLSAAGVHCVVSSDRLSMMGLLEVLESLGELAQIEKIILAYIDRNHVDLAIFVDFAGLHLRWAEAFKLRGIPVIQYVAPKLWAWGEERASQLAHYSDQVLAIFPFEESYFRRLGVNCSYVGSPQLERISPLLVQTSSAERQSSPRIALLPGSRKQELSYTAPLFIDLVQKILVRFPSASFVIPVAPSLEEKDFPSLLRNHPSVKLVKAQSLELMRGADLCVITSGTATLECALCDVPFVTVYRMNRVSYALALKKVKSRWIALPNILLGEELVREFIQNFAMEDLISEVSELWLNKEKRDRMQQGFSRLRAQLASPNGESASLYAARIVKRLLYSSSTNTSSL